MGHNSKVPIRIHERYLQIVLRFAKCEPPCEGRGKWIMDYGILPAKTDSEVLQFEYLKLILDPKLNMHLATTEAIRRVAHGQAVT